MVYSSVEVNIAKLVCLASELVGRQWLPITLQVMIKSVHPVSLTVIFVSENKSKNSYFDGH